MKFRVHWEIGDYEDFIDLEVEDLTTLDTTIDTQLKKRGIDLLKHSVWIEGMNGKAS